MNENESPTLRPDYMVIMSAALVAECRKKGLRVGTNGFPTVDMVEDAWNRMLPDESAALTYQSELLGEIRRGFDEGRLQGERAQEGAKYRIQIARALIADIAGTIAKRVVRDMPDTYVPWP